MAVLVEGISIIVRVDALRHKYSGGAAAFMDSLPNKMFCADGELARVGFMVPEDAQRYASGLEARGLVHLRHGAAVDLVVADQRRGLLSECEWASFGQTYWQENVDWPIRVCAHMPTKVGRVFVPKGWRYEASLSSSHKFVEGDRLPENFKLLRSEGDLDVYVDERTGKEHYIARFRP